MPDRTLHAPARPGRRRRAALVAAILVAVTGLPVVGGVPADAKVQNDAVSMAVVDVSPSTPTIATPKPQPLTVRISLTNTTGAALSSVTITGIRGAPYESVQSLDAALANPQPPGVFANEISTAHPVRVSLPAGATRTVAFTTTTSVTSDAGICICTAAGAYPLYFTASVGGTVLGSVQTYLPAFFARPKPLQVTWVWPLIDRPHRLQADDVFFDDDLAASVAGGRLDRALQALEDLVTPTRQVPLTVVIDPELLDELEVMATGHYQVQPAGKAVRPGTGAQAASAWLARLRSVLSADPALEVMLTPIADPDLEQATEAHLPWTAALPSAMQARITTALGGALPSGRVAWPVSGAVHATTLTSIAAHGLPVALLDETALRADLRPSDGAAADITTQRGTVRVLTSASDVTTAVDDAVSVGGTGTGALPNLLAEMAVRVAEDPTATHSVVLAPPRWVDAVPDIAARVIAETTTAFWTTPVAVTGARVADGSLAPRALTSPPANAPRLPAPVVSAARTVADGQPSLASLLGAHNPLVTQLPLALQRIESAAWVQDAATASALATQLGNVVTDTERGVFIVKPSSGTYTLASTSAPLPLTVENDLPYPVTVRVHVSTVNGLPGFRADDVVQSIDAHSKTPIQHLRATLVRNGRIQVEAVLTTSTGAVIGTPVVLSVRSTSLGLIGFVITIVSGAVLVVALLRRFWQRYRRRGTPPTVPDQPIAAGVA